MWSRTDPACHMVIVLINPSGKDPLHESTTHFSSLLLGLSPSHGGRQLWEKLAANIPENGNWAHMLLEQVRAGKQAIISGDAGKNRKELFPRGQNIGLSCILRAWMLCIRHMWEYRHFVVNQTKPLKLMKFTQSLVLRGVSRCFYFLPSAPVSLGIYFTERKCWSFCFLQPPQTALLWKQEVQYLNLNT